MRHSFVAGLPAPVPLNSPRLGVLRPLRFGLERRCRPARVSTNRGLNWRPDSAPDPMSNLPYHVVHPEVRSGTARPPRVYIGNQTAFSAPSPLQPFWYAVENQFDAFEWFPDKRSPSAGWDPGDLDTSARIHIRDTARAHGIRLSVHAPGQADPLQADSHPFLLQGLQLAHDLRAVLFNVHLGMEFGLSAFLQAVLPLIRQTAELGLQLSIENTPAATPAHFNLFFTQLRSLIAMPIDHVGMCLDIGHANLCLSTLNNYLQYFDQLDSQVPIIHLHLHENYGDSDTHLPLFTGPASQDRTGIFGLVQRLKKRAFSGSLILEQWPQPPLLLNQARDQLRQLWDIEGQRCL